MTTRQIILDTETTGLYATDSDNPDRLIEFAGLEMVNRQLTGKNLHLYINPQRDIAEDAIAIHGITLEQLQDKPVFQQVAQQIADFLHGAELIIHNAKFDVGFLDAEFKRVGMPLIEQICVNVIDTLSMAREQFPGQKNNLDALCNRFDIDRSRRVLHGALIDCELLGEVYLAMTRKQHSLVDETEDTQQNTPANAVSAPTTRPESLKIQRASVSENQEHEQYLNDLEQASGKTSLYRQPAA